MKKRISEFCIYTIAHKDVLSEAHRKGGFATFAEAKRWTAGYGLWRKAEKSGHRMPILIGDTTDCSRLLYWGVLTQMEIGEKKGTQLGTR